MRKSTLLKALLTVTAPMIFVCVTASAQHGAGHGGGGHGGGGGFHGGGGYSGGYHGGGYSGGYHGGGYAGGYHGGGYSGGMHGGPQAMPGGGHSGMSGGPSSARSFGGMEHPSTAHAAIADGQWHSFGSGHMAGGSTAASASPIHSSASTSVRGSAGRGGSVRSPAAHTAIADGQWHSFGNGRVTGGSTAAAASASPMRSAASTSAGASTNRCASARAP